MVTQTMKTMMVPGATWSSSRLQQMLPAFLDEYWATEPGFSDAKLSNIRNQAPEVKQRFCADKEYFSENIWIRDPADLGAALHNDIHPLFQTANFLTHLPMGEVLEQLLPALRLATMLTTNERALQWFAHVHFSGTIARSDGVKMLIRPAGSITNEQLSTVKRELLALADKVKFTWGSGCRFGRTRAGGLTCFRASDVAYILYECTYDKPPSRAIKSVLHLNDEDYHPFVFLNIEFFHTALQHSQHGATRVQQETNQFRLARLLMHELAHVWTGFCHPHTTTLDEPLAFPCDAFPEAGFSWEQFMFGAFLSLGQFENVLMANTFASMFRAPHHYLLSYVPQEYISQWFLQSTWDHFEDLHEAGELYAPSPDRQTAQFQLSRFCKTRKTQVAVLYINGYVAPPQRCCTEPNCGMSNPGNSILWPSNPEELFDAYMDVIRRDKKAANTMGVEYEPEKIEKSKIPEFYARETGKMDAYDHPNGWELACPMIPARPEHQFPEKAHRKTSGKPIGRFEMWLLNKFIDRHSKIATRG